MAIDFPNSPSVNDEFSVGDRTWKWTGTTWDTVADQIPGPANELTVGTVTTGDPGTNAVVEITGDSPNQTINFTIPRGNQGEQGVQGIQGIQGETGPQGPQGVAGADSSARYQFRYNTSTSGDPGPGYFRLNNSTMSSATELYIDVIDYDPNAYPNGNDLTSFFGSLTSYGSSTIRGSIKIEKSSDSTWYQQYNFSSVTDSSGYFTIGLSNIIADGNFTNDDICYISFILAGPEGPTGADGADGVGVPTGGTTGQVLAKASGTNYDTEWVDQSAGITTGKAIAMAMVFG